MKKICYILSAFLLISIIPVFAKVNYEKSIIYYLEVNKVDNSAKMDFQTKAFACTITTPYVGDPGFGVKISPQNVDGVTFDGSIVNPKKYIILTPGKIVHISYPVGHFTDPYLQPKLIVLNYGCSPYDSKCPSDVAVPIYLNCITLLK